MSEEYLRKQITSAKVISRKAASKGSFSILNWFRSENSGPNHKGVLVKTTDGKSILIEHPGILDTGVQTKLVNDKEISTEWKKEKDIHLNGYNTVETAKKGAGGITNLPIINYLTAGTCIGAANGIKKTLEK